MPNGPKIEAAVRFVCVPCRAEITMKNITYELANRTIGEMGWRIGPHIINKRFRYWCLCCPKCVPVAEANAQEAA